VVGSSSDDRGPSPFQFEGEGDPWKQQPPPEGPVVPEDASPELRDLLAAVGGPGPDNSEEPPGRRRLWFSLTAIALLLAAGGAGAVLLLNRGGDTAAVTTLPPTTVATTTTEATTTTQATTTSETATTLATTTSSTTRPTTTTTSSTTTTSTTTTTQPPTTTTRPPTTTTRPPTTTTTTLPVRVSVSPGSGAPGQAFTITATGLTPGGTAAISISGPSSFNPSPTTASAAGVATWWIGTSDGDPTGTYSVTVTDQATGRKGGASFTVE